MKLPSKQAKQAGIRHTQPSSMQAKQAGIRQALVTRFDGTEPSHSQTSKQTKRAPGRLSVVTERSGAGLIH